MKLIAASDGNSAKGTPKVRQECGKAQPTVSDGFRVTTEESGDVFVTTVSQFVGLDSGVAATVILT